LDKNIAFIIWARKLEGDRLKTLDFSWVLSDNDLWGELIWEKDGRILPSFCLFHEKLFFKIIFSLFTIKKIILFINYKKFNFQTFDCYIFCFEFFFSISPLRL